MHVCIFTSCRTQVQYFVEGRKLCKVDSGVVNHQKKKNGEMEMCNLRQRVTRNFGPENVT